METEKILLSEERLEKLREEVRAFQDGKRYFHTLAVEKEAVCLGEIFLPEEINRLRAAALLHDITKTYDSEKQLKICKDFGIIEHSDLVRSPKLFHAVTGAAVAERDFCDCTDKGIISAVRWHTTGRQGMTVFEMLIYLADYIEETRTFEDCKRLRRYFYDGISKAADGAERLGVLRETMILSFDMTVKALLEEGAPVDKNTLEAKEWFRQNEMIEA